MLRHVQFNPWGNTMKKLLVACVLAGASLVGSAHAGEFSNTVGWGHTSSGNTGRSTNHYNYGGIAAQEQDAANGTLSGSPTYITNQAIGSQNIITIEGNNNNVNASTTNTGNVGAQQGFGKGGGTRQAIQQ